MSSSETEQYEVTPSRGKPAELEESDILIKWPSQKQDAYKNLPTRAPVGEGVSKGRADALLDRPLIREGPCVDTNGQHRRLKARPRARAPTRLESSDSDKGAAPPSVTYIYIYIYICIYIYI